MKPHVVQLVIRCTQTARSEQTLEHILPTVIFTVLLNQAH